MEKQRLAWIGLGRMGVPMARNLLPAAAPLKIFNRNASRMNALAQAGATPAASPREAAEASDIVFTMVADDAALENVTLGDDGALGAMKPGSVLIDMSTVSPEISQKIATAAAAKHVAYLCAPVSGSVAMAESAKLTVLVSGPKDAIDRGAPLFGLLAAKQFAVGGHGEARVLKLSLNLMIGASAAMLGEALTLSEKAGLDWNVLLEVVANSAIASPFVQYKAGQLKSRDFSPMFMASQMAKDFGLIAKAATEMGVALPMADKVARYWREMERRGLGDLDFIACLKIVEQDSGID